MAFSRQRKETNTETFQRLYPYYMAIGMSYDEYWNDEAILVKYYRQAYLYKTKQRNQELWLQGLYTYYALMISLGNAFRKKGAKVEQYLERPFPLNALEIKEEKEYAERKEMAKIMSYVKGNLKYDPKG